MLAGCLVFFFFLCLCFGSLLDPEWIFAFSSSLSYIFPICLIPVLPTIHILLFLVMMDRGYRAFFALLPSLLAVGF